MPKAKIVASAARVPGIDASNELDPGERVVAGTPA